MAPIRGKFASAPTARIFADAWTVGRGPRSSAAPMHEVFAAKPPLVREGIELTSREVSKLPQGTRILLLEVREIPETR